MTTAILQQRVRLLLNTAGLSESELARRINIPRATLNRLFAGRMANPKMQVLDAIANYFDLSIDELMVGSIAEAKAPSASIALPLVPWENLHQSELFSQYPHQSWTGYTPLTGSFLAYSPDRKLDHFPNHKQMLLISPQTKPRPGQLVMLRLYEEQSNVIRQMFVAEQQFRFKHPTSQVQESLTPGSYQFLGVVQQILQLD